MKQSVVLGLGTNIGDRAAWLRKAVQAIKSLSDNQLKLLRQSAIYQSEAMLPENAPNEWDKHYLNLCLLCETSLSPIELLKLIKSVEQKLGRTQTSHWGPREIDIDILAYGNETYSSSELKIPHSGLLTRPFAALPFRDVWPDWEIPGSSGRTIQNLCAQWPIWADESGPFETKKTPLILTEMMGILNLTPDSFSDGGKYNTVDKALRQFESLSKQGASVIDIGAESTRPGATPLTADIEWSRLLPFLQEISRVFSSGKEKPLLSLDTRHPEVARKAIELGIDCINDISGLASAEMVQLAKANGTKLIFMHSLSIPPSRNQTMTTDSDPIDSLLQWGKRKMESVLASGVSLNQIIFDPGIGFGKTQKQNLAVMEDVQRFHELGVPILVGHSRKSFLATWFDRPAADRDPETAVFSQYLGYRGIEYVRVHNVEASKRAMEARMLLKNATIDFI